MSSPARADADNKSDAPKKLGVFDIVNDLSCGKKDLLHDEETGIVDSGKAKVYCAYVINKAFSLHLDTLLDAQLMNEFPQLDVDLQHDYYLFGVRKGRRFSKWFKPEFDDVDKTISTVYDVNSGVAKMFRNLLSPQQLASIVRIQPGGTQ